MHYIPSQDRFQIHFQSMEDRIDKDNPVRFIMLLYTNQSLPNWGLPLLPSK